MVEKIVKRPPADYYVRVANEVKETPVNQRFHTRPCYELNEQKNCKITTEKKLTGPQRDLYNQILEEQRIKEEIKENKKKKRKSAATKERYKYQGNGGKK